MRLCAFRSLWGLQRESLESVLPRLARKGYVGVEAALQNVSDLDELRTDLEELRMTSDANGLAIKPLLILDGESPAQQLAAYRKLLGVAAGFDPIAITVLGGRDCWPLERSIEFYRRAVALEAEFGVEVGHETHRGCSLFTPWGTAAILEAVPELRLTCDFSHWVVVGERLLHDQADAIDAAAERAIHLHTRVGYDQGPQVPDPRAPEWAEAREAHERWWEIVWEAQERVEMVASTFTAELGPPPYLHTLPFTNVPVADLEEVCDWQTARVHERFGAWSRRT